MSADNGIYIVEQTGGCEWRCVDRVFGVFTTQLEAVRACVHAFIQDLLSNEQDLSSTTFRISKARMNVEFYANRHPLLIDIDEDGIHLNGPDAPNYIALKDEMERAEGMDKLPEQEG